MDRFQELFQQYLEASETLKSCTDEILKSKYSYFQSQVEYASGKAADKTAELQRRSASKVEKKRQELAEWEAAESAKLERQLEVVKDDRRKKHIYFFYNIIRLSKKI